MTISNVALYNGALAGAVAGFQSNRDITNTTQASYAPVGAAATALAQAIDAHAPTGNAVANVYLMMGLVQAYCVGKYPTWTSPTQCLEGAAAIAAAYAEMVEFIGS